jgi:ABC-2 type transport system permease protein
MNALYAEWTKLRTLPAAIWLLAGAVLSTVAVSAVTIATATCHAAACGQDPGKITLTGTEIGQAVVAVLAVLAIGDEYGTGMIRLSLTAAPRRLSLLAAKLAALTGPVLVASAVAVGACVTIGRLILPGHGFTPAHGFELGSLGALAGPFRMVIYLTLIAALSLGVATAVRDSAAAVGVVLGLLYLFPVAASMVRDHALQRLLEQVGPLSAGLDAQAANGLGNLPLTPWQGLGVVAAWAAGALLLGGLALRVRDA